MVESFHICKTTQILLSGYHLPKAPSPLERSLKLRIQGRGLPQEGGPCGVPFLTPVPSPPSSSLCGRQPSPSKRRASLPQAPRPPPHCLRGNLPAPPPLAVVTQADGASSSPGSTRSQSWPLPSSQESSQQSSRHVLSFSGSPVPFLCHGGGRGRLKSSLHLPPQDGNPTSMSARIWVALELTLS